MALPGFVAESGNQEPCATHVDLYRTKALLAHVKMKAWDKFNLECPSHLATNSLKRYDATAHIASNKTHQTKHWCLQVGHLVGNCSIQCQKHLFEKLAPKPERTDLVALPLQSLTQNGIPCAIHGLLAKNFSKSISRKAIACRQTN